MRLLVIFDGSDDGYHGLQTAAALVRQAGTDHEITIAIAGWPPRPSPIWDRAFERQVVRDDLHRAMAEVAAEELHRLRELFAPLGAIATAYAEGEIVAEIVALIDRSQPDLLIVGLTRGKRARVEGETLLALLEHTSIPVFVTFGQRAPRDP